MALAGLLLLSAAVKSFPDDGKGQDGLADASFLSRLEKEVILEINQARRNPGRYQYLLKENRIYYRGKKLEIPGRIPVVTREGVAALDEAIGYLRRQSGSPPLSPSRGMSLGARDLVNDQQISGAVGHADRDGKDAGGRVNRYGTWQVSIGENIEYGSAEARGIVTNLIIDDGVPGRGHRTNLFDPGFKRVGVACGLHRIYRNMCVIIFAGAYREK
jgi:hypothetical protein